MVQDYFLAVDGIEGESDDNRHPKEIVIESWSWGATQAGARGSGGGAGAGKVVVQDFSFTTKVSKATPKLFLACATGQHISSAVLTVRKAGGQQQEYYTIKLSDCLVSSYQQSGPSAEGSEGDNVPVDMFSLNFAKVEIEYKAQRPDGTLEPPITAGYDLKANKKL